MRRLHARVLFEPRDWWIGAYVPKEAWEGPWLQQRIYICIVPWFPVLITWTRRDLTKEV